MHFLFVFIAFFSLLGTGPVPLSSPAAIDISGTWKRTAMTMVDAGGKTTDLNQTLQKSMPCMKDVKYIFLGDGQMKADVPESCGPMKKTIEDMSVKGKWAISGGKLVITTTMDGIPPATYDVSFSGTSMTWVFSYADNPKTPNPTKAVRLTTVYQRM